MFGCTDPHAVLSEPDLHDSSPIVGHSEVIHLVLKWEYRKPWWVDLSSRRPSSRLAWMRAPRDFALRRLRGLAVEVKPFLLSMRGPAFV